MDCPFCHQPDSQVRDSRPTADNAIRRRRVCTGCDARFTTHERVTLRELVVIKRSGRRQLFDAEKLARSVGLAIAGLSLDPARVNAMTTKIVQGLEATGDVEITSDTIGAAVMAGLRALNDVAFVRYASVYRVFTCAADFAKFINEENLT